MRRNTNGSVRWEANADNGMLGLDCVVTGGLALAFYSYLDMQCSASSTYAQGAIWTMARESALDSLTK